LTNNRISLAQKHPELAKQADGWDPTSVTAGSGQRLPWKCEVGHTWSASVNNRAKGRGCPICAGKQVLIGFNDLATSHPGIAAQAHGWDPKTRTAGSSNIKVEWRCSFGHIWNAVVAHRSRGRGCPICAGKQVLIGFNDLATSHPEIATQAHGWDPQTVTAGSNKEFNWKCKFGHVWSAIVNSRSRGRGCPVCTGRQVLSGFNDLQTTNPEIAKEAKGWDPTTVRAGSHQKFKWVCSHGHEYLAAVGNRTGFNKTGCAVCSGQQVLSGFNDLATTHPEIAAEAHGWDPRTVNAGSNPKKRWKCTLGHTWMATPNNRTGRNQSGCPICANKEVLIGYNDLTTINPELAEQAYEWDPSSLTQSSTKKRKWKCQFGHVWTSTPADRTRGNGCPTCSISGFDPNREAWFYFIKHDEWNMLQIGITTQPKVRLESHERLGWRLLELRGPLEGHHIQELETVALRALKKRKAIFANNAGGQVFDGWTEAWTKASLSVTSIKQILNWVYEDERLPILGSPSDC